MVWEKQRTSAHWHGRWPTDVGEVAPLMARDWGAALMERSNARKAEETLPMTNSGLNAGPLFPPCLNGGASVFGARFGLCRLCGLGDPKGS